MFQNINVIDDEESLIEDLRNIFKQEPDFKFKNVSTNEVETALRSIPDLIIVNESSINVPITETCRKIRENEDNSITPVIVISPSQDEEHKLSIIKNLVEYVIEEPVNKEEIYYVIKNIIRLLYANRRVSPLTGLPGNVQILTELKKRVLKRREFVVLYLDLDNFKAYNDVYGFLKGDEIIKFTADVITRNIHLLEDTNTFIGHIGGDDFVAIVDGDMDYENICQNIIAEFDIEVLKYFNDVDIERRYLEVQNRKGVIEKFPLTSISIGAVVADEKRFANILEIGEIGAQVKHLAKMTMGSSYAIDRRNT